MIIMNASANMMYSQLFNFWLFFLFLTLEMMIEKFWPDTNVKNKGGEKNLNLKSVLLVFIYLCKQRNHQY